MKSNTPPSPQKLARDGTRRGGARPGAGRKKAARLSPTAINDVDLAAALATPAPKEIEHALRGQAQRSLAALVRLMTFGTSDSARIAAAKEVLDRGFGKPAVDIGGDAAAPMLPFGMAPPPSALAESDIRAEAQNHARAAILVLTTIADRSLSETARVAANRALLERECGMVGTARMPEDMRDRPLGKKEQAARAAEAAASGAFATRAPPRNQMQ